MSVGWRFVSRWAIVGIDVNTNSTGLAAVDAALPHRVLYCAAVDTSSAKEFIPKCELLSGGLSQLRHSLLEKYDAGVAQVVIEEFLMSFARGGSNTMSLFKLAKINAGAHLLAHQLLQPRDGPPVSVNASAARSALGIKKSSDPDRDIKTIVFDRFSPAVPPDLYPWRRLRTGRLADENFDVTDALLLAFYGIQRGSMPPG